MAHFAELDENNKVLRVIVINNSECKDQDGKESEVVGTLFCHKLLGGRWKQTSYNANFRKNFAGLDYEYDEQRDAFIPPKPYASHVLNEEKCIWEPPVPYPTDGKIYYWNEETLSWIEIE